MENHEPFGAKWSMFCRLKVRSYVLAANVAGTLKVAPLQILKFPVVLPHKFLDAEKFNLRFSDASEITEIADKLGVSLGNLKHWEQNRKQIFKSTWEKYFKQT